MLKQAIILRPSYLLVAFLMVTHLGALVVLISLSLAWFVILPVSILVLLSLIHNLRYYALQLNSKAIIKLELKEKNEWLLQDKQGNFFAAELVKNSFRGLYLVVLNFKRVDNNKKLSVIIFPDSLTKELFRRLRAALLFT